MGVQVDPERQEEEGGVDEIARAGVDLRFAGHRLQGLTDFLNARYEDTLSKLEKSSDRDARKITLELSREFKKLNDALAAHCMRLSNSNRGAMGLLKKTEDGRAAVTMRKAAELLVKVHFQRLYLDFFFFLYPPQRMGKTKA